MMKHNYTNDDTFLARWLNKELSEEETINFKKTEDYKLFQKIADKSKLYTVPEFREEEVLAKIKAKLEAPKVKKLIPTWVYGVAAAVLIMFGISFLMENSTSYSAIRGQQLAYMLPDGSEVRLNGNSSVHFKDKEWQKGNRSLALEGEGYFKVKKGSTFAVKTKQGVVTVLGTEFNVQTLSQYLAVECYEGKVSVKNNVFESILTPGKGVKFTKNKKENYNIKISEPNWIQQNYQYNGVPLGIVFKDLENQYKMEVVYGNLDINQTYSGTLVTNNLEKALIVICKPMGISYQIENNKVLLSK